MARKPAMQRVNTRMADIKAKNRDYGRYATPAKRMQRNAMLGNVSKGFFRGRGMEGHQAKVQEALKGRYDPQGPTMADYTDRRRKAMAVKRRPTAGYAKRQPVPVIAGAESFRTAVANDPALRQQIAAAQPAIPTAGERYAAGRGAGRVAQSVPKGPQLPGAATAPTSPMGRGTVGGGVAAPQRGGKAQRMDPRVMRALQGIRGKKGGFSRLR